MMGGTGGAIWDPASGIAGIMFSTGVFVALQHSIRVGRNSLLHGSWLRSATWFLCSASIAPVYLLVALGPSRGADSTCFAIWLALLSGTLGAAACAFRSFQRRISGLRWLPYELADQRADALSAVIFIGIGIVTILLPLQGMPGLSLNAGASARLLVVLAVWLWLVSAFALVSGTVGAVVRARSTRQCDGNG